MPIAALLSFIVAAVAFFLVAVKVTWDTVLLVDWGLFFLALGLVLERLATYVDRRRAP
jgi:hypothetical protein